MGFGEVYRTLQELFPLIDIRILRAVAIEHASDLNAAIDDVLTDILPHIPEVPALIPRRSQGLVCRKDGACENQGMKLKLKEVVNCTDDGPSSISSSAPKRNVDDVDSASTVTDMYSGSLHTEALQRTSISNTRMPLNQYFDANVGPNLTSNWTLFTPAQLSGEGSDGNQGEVHQGYERCDWPSTSDTYTIADKKSQKEESPLDSSAFAVETFVAQLDIACDPLEDKVVDDDFNCNHKDESSLDSTTLEVEESVAQLVVSSDDEDNNSGNYSDDEDNNSDDEDNNSGNYSDDEDNNSGNYSDDDEDNNDNDDLDCNHNEEKFVESVLWGETLDSIVQRSLSSNDEHTQGQDAGFGFLSEDNFGAGVTDCEIPETGDSVDPTIHQENSHNSVSVLETEDQTTLNTVSRSGQICSRDFLEDIIEDAKNNKKILFSAMESVVYILKEVELEEKNVEEAKAKAARAGLSILSKTEELKEMLHRAKDLNDMHAGEVYGEKSILATEARELQSRLVSMSDERDKSLADLDEMRQTFEIRLAAAEEERKVLEQERLDKEESALAVLAVQKDIMEKVVQESNRLQEEEEENSKLREFLVDRGRIVDILQGEISVICQDVRLLKERFDGNVPLSASVSSSQTSCILASSSSLVKSVDCVGVLDEQSKSPPPSSIDGQSPKKLTSSAYSQSPNTSPVQKQPGAVRETLLDDEWDLFDTEVFDA